MTFLRPSVFAAALALCLASSGAAQEAPPANGSRPRVFFDCQGPGCNSDYFRTEIAWVTWVRDRTDAQVHVIVVSTGTGAGGRAYEMEFQGRNGLSGYTDHVVYTSRPTDTERETLDGMTHVLALGLARSTEHIEGEDRRIASIRDVKDIGFGVRVLYHGAWGFAASSIFSLEEVPRGADLAIEIAKGSASVALEKVRLAPEPVHRDRIITPYRIDPFNVPLEKKTDLLLNTMETLHRQTGIARSSASLWARRDVASCSSRRRGHAWSSICWPGKVNVPRPRCMKAGLLRAASICRISGKAMN